MPTRDSAVSSDRSFEQLVAEATAQPIEGWDFSFVAGRIESEDLPWHYSTLAARELKAASKVLDVDTGGGELFASLAPPAGSIAVEPYPPNVPVATERLALLAIDVRERKSDHLPIADGAVDLVLNRHGAVNPAELHRVLMPGGRLLTQQVGAANDLEFNDALDVHPAASDSLSRDLSAMVVGLTQAGFEVDVARKARPVTRYLDIGAVVFQLRMVSWQVPGFDPVHHDDQLRAIHERIGRDGSFDVHSHRMLIRAHRN